MKEDVFIETGRKLAEFLDINKELISETYDPIIAEIAIVFAIMSNLMIVARQSSKSIYEVCELLRGLDSIFDDIFEIEKEKIRESCHIH